MIPSKTGRARRAGAAALLLAAASTPAFAIPSIGPGLEYEDTASVLCAATTCTATFSMVPVGKTLIIKQVGCRLQSTKDVFNAYLTSTQTAHKVYFSPELLMVYQQQRNIYSANSEVTHIAKMLTQPSVTVSTLPPGKVVEVACQIGGQLE